MVRSSRPPSLTTLVRRALTQDCGVKRGDSILVAVSGGLDSMALVHALALVSPKLELRLMAVGIDHGLRPEAASELDLADALCQRLAIPFERVQLKIAAGGNLQARAREARYRALRHVQSTHGLDWLATAHHGDDRAETVLLRLLRGAPPQGLRVLPPRAGDLIRPMLRAQRADVLLHLERHQIDVAEDPSNRDARFLRVRIRCELLPMLKDLSPGIVQHLNAFADELSQAALPEVRDESGARLLLGRAQRQELRKALRDRSSRARVLLKGARSLGLNRASGQPEFFQHHAPSSGKSKARASKTPKKG